MLVQCVLALLSTSFAVEDYRGAYGSFQEDGGLWSIRYQFKNGVYVNKQVQCGTVDDIPVPADYYNEGVKRLAVFRPSNGTWYIKAAGYKDWAAKPGNNVEIQCGTNGDVPVPGDYDGDGKISIAVFRPSNGYWYFKGPGNMDWGDSVGNRELQCGSSEDIPVPMDYFNEGALRMAVYRPSTGMWYIKGPGFNHWGSSAGNLGIQCGSSEDVPVPGDYYGDGVVRLAVWRPSNGYWYIKGTGTQNWGSTHGNVGVQCGTTGDIPAPYDYFGEGKLRMAVYRPSTGMLYIKGEGFSHWGDTEGNLQLEVGSGQTPVDMNIYA